MTRQKKELIKQIEEIEWFINADIELSCGNYPSGAYDEMYSEIWELQEQLAKLRHYGSAEEMLLDCRGQRPEEDMPRKEKNQHTGGFGPQGPTM